MSITSNAKRIEDGLGEFLKSKGYDIKETFTVSEGMFKGNNSDDILAVAVERKQENDVLDTFWEMKLNGEHKIKNKYRSDEYVLPKEFMSKIEL